jgi:predicted transcriptional regulator of viral defense system
MLLIICKKYQKVILFAYKKMNEMIRKSIANFIDSLQAKGQYYFTRTDIENSLILSKDAVKLALARLVKKNRIVMVKHGFYLILPLEYRISGVLPASWFINDLMMYMKLPYYVGLLSAAALEGASHQQPQEYHVFCEKQIRTLQFNALRIKFLVKKQIPNNKFLKEIKTETGYMSVSAPELTAMDLVRYNKASGGLNHVATVISELGEHIHPHKLLSVAKETKTIPSIQRLGFLLDILGYENKTVSLNKWVKKNKIIPVQLDTSIDQTKKISNKKWSIWVNRILEVDEV